MIESFSFRAIFAASIALLISGFASSADARPAAPTDVTATAISSTAIAVAWTDPDVVTSFSIERSARPDRDFAEIVVVPGKARSYTDSGLGKSTTYYYRMRALYGGNYSRRCAVVSATTFGDVTPTPLTTATPASGASGPTVPTGLTLTIATCTQVNVSWSASSAAAGRTITGYNLYRNGVFARTVSATATSDTGLTAATLYNYAVSALDSAGVESARTATKSVATPGCTTPPLSTVTPVSTVTATPTRTATAVPTVTVTATLTRTTTPTPIVTATAAPTRTATPVPTLTITTTPTRTATPVPTLTITTTPTRTATAVPTVTLTATPTRTVTATPKPTQTATPTKTATPVPTSTPDGTAPSVPGGFRADPMSCNQINLSWNASTDTGGSGLKGYNVYSSAVLLRQVAAPATSTVHTSLQGGTPYSYTITAIDNAGNESNASAAVYATTPACNIPPVANAGPDIAGTSGTAVALNGTGSADPDGQIMSYTWSFGDGATGSGAAPVHTYMAPGAYTATLTVLDNAGATASDTAKVTVAVGPPGAVVWRQARGGTGFEVGHGIAVDGSGNVLVTGTFTDTADFGTGALRSAGEGDVFLAKYTSAGAPVWSKRFGGTGSEIAYSVAADRSANCDGAGGTNCVVIAGLFSDTVNFGGAALTSAGGLDIFVAKYSASGAHVWSKRFGSIYDDVGYGVVVDGNGNAFLTGFFTDSTDFGGGTLYSQYNNRDAFVAKFASNGTHVWSKNFWSTSTDAAQAIALDANGDVAITGFFTGSLDFGTGALNAVRDDIFVTKLAGADGHAVWAKVFGGSDVDRGQGIAFDRGGNVLVTGLVYNGTVDFGGGPLTTGYDQDGFLVKLTGAAGAHVWSKLLNGPNSDGGLSVAADGNDNVMVVGYFQGTTDFAGATLTSAGSASVDIVVADYSSAGALRWVDGFGGTSADGWQGGHVAVDPTTNAVVLASSFETTADFGGVSLTTAGSDDVCIVKLQP